MDVIFAQPTQPASDPRVRAFAELALKEVRLGGGDGSDTSLLTDKAAFSEFMDKVNESVLLGLREPPSAAFVTAGAEDTSQQENKDSTYRSVFDDNEAASPPAEPCNSDSNSGNEPFTVANPFESLPSRDVFPPRWHPRQTNDNAALGYPALRSQTPPPSSARPQRVRFDDNAADEDFNTGEQLPSKQPHYRKPGDRIRQQQQQEQHEQRRMEEASEGDDSTLSTCGLDGPKLLQELRKWRTEAATDLNTNLNLNRLPFLLEREVSPTSSCCRPSPFLRRAPPLSTSAWVGAGLAAGARPPPPSSAPLPAPDDALSSGEKRIFPARHPTDGSVTSLEPHATENTGGHCRDDGEGRRVEDGQVSRNATMATKESYGRYPRGAAKTSAQGQAQRDSPVVPDHRQHKLANRKADFSARYQGQCSGFEGGGSGALMTEERRRFGGADGRGEEAEQGEGRDDNTEVSLDLSDCSEEKLVSLLERGRRRGSS